MSTSVRSRTLRPASLHRPARNVTSRSGPWVRGKFPSLKNGRSVGYEQLLERDALVLFEFSSMIESYIEQPRSVFYPFGSGMRKYTPDFELTLADGSRRKVIVEIKPSAQLERTEVKEKLQAIEDYFADHGQAFTVLTEHDIRRQPRLDNLTWLRTHLRPRGSTGHRTGSLRMLEKHEVQTFGEARATVGDDGLALLVWSGHVQFDVDEPLISAAPIRLSEKPCLSWFAIRAQHGF